MTLTTHDVFVRYGFLLSNSYRPNFSVPHYQRPNEKVHVDYWHPNRNLVIHALTANEQGEEVTTYIILDTNGIFITELFHEDDCRAFFSELFSNDVEPIDQPNRNISAEYNPPMTRPSSIQNLRQLYSPLPPQYPLPTFDIHNFLNAPLSTYPLNLENIIPSNHVIHKMASYLNREFPLPMSTLILVGLGVASGLTARKWNCAYQKRGTSPICLYVVAEQKSGKGKTATLNAFQEPLRNIVNELIKKIKCEIQIQTENLASHSNKEADHLSKEDKATFKFQTKKLKEQIESSDNKLKNYHALLPKTRVTAEALEESLNNTNGFFLVAADEQALIDSLIMGKATKSNDILLSGRNAGDVNSSLISRKGYNGKVTGSFICFAQEGCIEKIMRASGQTGLCERFLMISEPELPDRFHSEFAYHYQNTDSDDSVLNEYASKFNFLRHLIKKPLEHDELITLKISTNGWHDIKMFQNELTRDKQNGYLSHPTLSVMASKSDMQIMSIAANLYLLDLDETTQPSKNGDNYIPDQYVQMAIEAFCQLINGVRQYCEANGIIGDKEQIAEVMDCFFDKKTNKFIDLSLEQIKHKCEQRKSFKNIKDKRILIVDLLNWLNQNNIILFNDGMYFKNLLPQQIQLGNGCL